MSLGFGGGDVCSEGVPSTREVGIWDSAVQVQIHHYSGVGV